MRRYVCESGDMVELEHSLFPRRMRYVTEADALANTAAEVAKAVEKERKAIREWCELNNLEISGKKVMDAYEAGIHCTRQPPEPPLEAPRDVNVPYGWFGWAEQITAAVNELRKASKL